MKKLSIIIPVYNEKNTIREIIKKVEAVDLDGFEKEIIIIDDFSTDGTREILSSLNKSNFKILFQNENIGKGAAVRAGFGELTGDVILIQDADLEYDPSDYPKLIRPILEDRADVVYGSRFLNSETSSNNRIVYRRGYIFSRILNLFSNILNGLRVTDMYTCYKVFSAKAAKKITPKIKSRRFGIDPEITALLARNKFRVLEVPIKYEGRTYEEGKKINWKDALAAIWHIIRFNLFTRC